MHDQEARASELDGMECDERASTEHGCARPSVTCEGWRAARRDVAKDHARDPIQWSPQPFDRGAVRVVSHIVSLSKSRLSESPQSVTQRG